MKTTNFFLTLAISCILYYPLVTYANSNSLTHAFDSTAYHYSIHYPENWTPRDLGNGVVVFRFSSIKPSYKLLVNIQTIYTKKAGGHYATVKDLMDDFISQVPLHTSRSHFSDRKPITLPQPNSNSYSGESITLTFNENGQVLKHWQVMVMSRDGRVFQAWAYRAPVQYYDINYPIASAMLATWVFN